MRKVAILGLSLMAAMASGKDEKKAAGTEKGECAPGAICFSGEIREGHEFRKSLNAELDFVVHLPGGFDVLSSQPNPGCKLGAWVANPPLQAHHATEIDAGYDWTAEAEVQASPREFRFATNCADYQRLFDLSQGNDAKKYFADLPQLAKGQGRFWITEAKVTHSHGSVSRGNGAIERMKFRVEIQLPGGSPGK